MNSPSSPRISRAASLPLVWIVPVVALLICGWLGVRELWNLGPKITIDFADGTGVEAGKTVLEYNGVSVGTVDSVIFRRDLSGVIVQLRLDRRAAALATEGSKFWIVHPEIGFSGVRGLDTLLTGSRLNVQPGNGRPARHFVGLERPPTPEIPRQGRTFILESSRLGSLTAGAPVFYREFKVGEVEASRLSDDATEVLIRIHVEEPYVNLVRTGTRFWNAGGFSFKVGLFGAQLKDTSLESLVSGGVAFATPDGAALGVPAPDGTAFKLSADPDADWLKWAPRIPVKSLENVSKPPQLAGALPGLIKP
jgi:paraquat-inducible protein B